MARPLSEQKRQAILTAAAELVAAIGTGAPTAKVAKAAGVAEGTIFTYFPTKDDLLNELFVEIETSLAEAMRTANRDDGTPRERVRRTWNRLIEWGVANPASRRALRQLKVSDRVNDESRRRCEALLRDARQTVELGLLGHAVPERMIFYIDTVLFALADSVTEAVAASPRDRSELAEAGFELFWKGVAA